MYQYKVMFYPKDSDNLEFVYLVANSAKSAQKRFEVLYGCYGAKFLGARMV